MGSVRSMGVCEATLPSSHLRLKFPQERARHRNGSCEIGSAVLNHRGATRGNARLERHHVAILP